MKTKELQIAGGKFQGRFETHEDCCKTHWLQGPQNTKAVLGSHGNNNNPIASLPYLPNFAYSSMVFFSPTLKPSVSEACRSSSAWLAIVHGMIKT